MIVAVILLGSAALGVALGFGGVYWVLTRGPDITAPF